MNAERLDDARLLIDPAAAVALESGRVDDAFAVLGPHADGTGTVVRAFVPPAESVDLIGAQDELLASMQPVGPKGLFVGRFAGAGG